MTSQRRLLMWALAAFGACAVLAGVFLWEQRWSQRRWGVFLAGDPQAGARLFFGKKGCAHCHAVNGSGGNLAADLGFQSTPHSNLNQLVTAMWNHAPRMWQRMRDEKIIYPSMDREEMTHLFAFLYTTRYVEEPGDEERGARLFETKGCLRCHSVYGVGGKRGPDLSLRPGLDTPIRWAQAMWNHAPAMEASMPQVGLSWPKFEGREMNDLVAYIRQVSRGPRQESQLLPASPERGAKLFQNKYCIFCHSVKGQGGRIGPELAPRSRTPLTIVQFAETMWNHSPAMLRALKVQGIPRPAFEGQEIADLAAFLATLNYFEPGGSPQTGSQLFAARGCSRCHGSYAEGTGRAPALGGRNAGFNTILFAEALWRHGPKMYERAQEYGYPWPILREGDVGDLVAFLNAPSEERRR